MSHGGQEPHRYSAAWFDRFLRPIPAAQTEAEAIFLERALPLPGYSRVLDVCCGLGRHSRALAARGYQVTGVDCDPGLIAEARRLAGGVTYYVADMRDLTPIPGVFDAALILWQSFGQFAPAANDAVLAGIAARLRAGGRFVLDINHRAFFAAHTGERRLERDGQVALERTSLAGARLQVTLDYGSGPPDRFEWELFTPEEIAVRAAPAGLRLLRACSGFDLDRPADPAVPRMQLVFERS
jgi:SAM-dependent methyltransferase